MIGRRTRPWFLFLLLVGVLATGQVVQTKHAATASTVQLQVSGMNATATNGIYTIKFNSSGTGYSLVWNGKELIGSGKGFIFRNGYNAERSGAFPTLSDIKNSTTIQNETFKLANGTVYTKYDWASYIAADHVHGMYGSGYGVWMIPASHEYYQGGPMKQELMVHVESATGDGTVLNMLVGGHFGTPASLSPTARSMDPGWSTSSSEQR